MVPAPVEYIYHAHGRSHLLMKMLSTIASILWIRIWRPSPDLISHLHHLRRQYWVHPVWRSGFTTLPPHNPELSFYIALIVSYPNA
jgi:hypothetical protein